MTRFWILLALIVLPLSTACGTTASNVIVVSAGNKGPRKEILNESFYDEVSFDGGKAFYKGDIMEATVTLRSNEDEAISYQYKDEWFDGDGIQMDDTASLWTPDTIDARQAKQITVAAPRAGAVLCRFMVRRPLKN